MIHFLSFSGVFFPLKKKEKILKGVRIKDELDEDEKEPMTSMVSGTCNIQLPTQSHKKEREKERVREKM